MKRSTAASALRLLALAAIVAALPAVLAHGEGHEDAGAMDMDMGGGGDGAAQVEPPHALAAEHVPRDGPAGPRRRRRRRELRPALDQLRRRAHDPRRQAADGAGEPRRPEAGRLLFRQLGLGLGLE